MPRRRVLWPGRRGLFALQLRGAEPAVAAGTRLHSDGTCASRSSRPLAREKPPIPIVECLPDRVATPARLQGLCQSCDAVHRQPSGARRYCVSSIGAFLLTVPPKNCPAERPGFFLARPLGLPEGPGSSARSRRPPPRARSFSDKNVLTCSCINIKALTAKPQSGSET